MPMPMLLPTLPDADDEGKGKHKSQGKGGEDCVAKDAARKTARHCPEGKDLYGEDRDCNAGE